MLKALKIKFVTVIMLIVAITLTVICGLIMYFTKASLEQESIQLLRSTAAVGFHRNERGEPPFEMRTPSFSVQIMPDGEIKAVGNGYFDLTDEEFLSEVVKKALESGNQTDVIAEHNLRYSFTPSPMGKTISFIDISGEKAMLDNLLQSCIIISAVSFTILFAVSIFLANWAVKPVAKAWEQQKQFVADASHELKTPLTVIMTNAEMLNEREGDKFSDSILKMSKRMRGLVESMLELARADNGTMTLSFTDFDLSEAVLDSILPFEPLFFEKGLTLTSSIESKIRVHGDKSRLCQVFDILLDNAMKYSADNSEVVVTLKRQGNSTVVSVASRGELLSKQEQKAIFDRFYRVDKARTDGHSYGLGLSIAKSIIAEHKGKIWAESENEMNIFFVKLGII